MSEFNIHRIKEQERIAAAEPHNEQQQPTKKPIPEQTKAQLPAPRRVAPHTSNPEHAPKPSQRNNPRPPNASRPTTNKSPPTPKPPNTATPQHPHTPRKPAQRPAPVPRGRCGAKA